MVNFGLNSASILGIFIAVAGASLYFLRSVRPELSRDHDIFFAAVGLLCGFILLFQGWRLDPILQFGQFLLTGSAIFFAVESIRLRGVATEQARRNSRVVDDERPVSSTRVYRAELDQLEPYDYDREDDYENPRLRGYQEPRSTNRRVEREEPPTKRSPRSRSRSNVYGESPSPKTRTRPSRPSNRPMPENQYEEDWREIPDHWEEEDYNDNPPSPPSRPPSRPSTSSRPPSSRRRRPNPMDIGTPYNEDEEIPATDYVEYQPLDEEENNNPSWDQDESDQDWDRQEKPRKPINFDY
jgi:hypothetical protein